MDPVRIKCYVCNIKTDDWRSNLIGLKSQHSETLISEFIKKILGNFKSMRNVDDETNCICAECVNKIEKYDWTCMLAKQCESELYEILVQTETSCLNDDDETEMVGGTDGADESFDDMLLVEAFTPMIQMNCDTTTEEELIPQNDLPTKKEECEPIDEAVDDHEEDLGHDSEFEDQYESNSSYDEEDDDEFCDEEDEDFVAPQTRPETTDEETTGEQSTERSRPRTRVKREPNEQRRVGRPKTRQESGEKRKAGRPRLHPQRNQRKREKKTYECKECEKIFVKQVEFVLHKRWHREQAIPKFRCSKCFYISRDQETFDAHAKLHDNVDPLQCVICHVKVSCKGTLTKHTKSHQDIQNFQCHLCGKQFVRSMSLQIHMKYHLNIRTKQCPHCPMTFVESKNLNRHLKTHTQIKPYSCSICGKRFAHSYNVKPHEKTHTDPNVYRKFKCNFCKSAFDSKAKLCQHLQKSHSMITPHLENTNNLNEEIRTGPARWVVKDILQKDEFQTETMTN